MGLRPTLRIAAVAALAATLVAGCAAIGGNGAPSDTISDVRAQVEPIYRELAQCIRDHGFPAFPDPVVKDDGTVELPEDAQRTLEQHEAALRPHCEHIFNRLPASVREGPDTEEQATPAQIAERMRFAQCVRQHGVPDFPDPDAKGSINLSAQPGSPVRLSPAALSAFEACGMRGRRGVDLKRGLSDLGVR